MSRPVRTHAARFALIVLAVSLAAFVATGCGSKKSGNGSIASSAKGVDYVPRSALLYIVFDLDFDGDAWKQANDLMEGFDGYDDGKKELIDQIGKEGDVDYKKDIKPWLGEQAGIAVLKVTPKKEAENDNFFAWIDVKDEKKAKTFIDRETEKVKSTSYEGYDIVTSKPKDEEDAETVYALKDETLLIASKVSSVRAAIRASKGKSIKDTPGYDDVASEVEDDALGSLYVSGPAVRKLLDSAVDEAGAQADSVRSLLDVPQLRALQGFAMGLSPEEHGFRLKGHVGYDDEQLGNESLGENFKPELSEELPGTTVLAFGGDNLGKGVDKLIESLKDSQPAVSQQIAQVEAMLGVTIDDIIDVLSGQFSIAVLGGGGTKGAAMPVVGAVFEAKDEAKSAKVLEKLLGASTLATGSPATKKTVAGVKVIQAKSGTNVVTAGTFDGKMVVGTSEQFVSQIKTGTATLGDADVYSKLHDDSGAPDEVGGFVFVDVKGMVTAFKSSAAGAMLKSDKADKVSESPLTGLLGWVVNDDDSQTIELFMGIDDKE